MLQRKRKILQVPVQSNGFAVAEISNVYPVKRRTGISLMKDKQRCMIEGKIQVFPDIDK
jgi:hypothetical protein